MTLTMRNVSDLSHDAVRHLRRAFGKLRNRKLWRAHVLAGVASIEVTNIGNGWHPHLHAVLDCRWLAYKTPEPGRKQTPTTHPEIYQAAAAELEAAWSRCLGQETSSVKIKRCSAETVTKEVLKYSIKGSDLIESPDRIGDIIRALDATRLLTTFGRAHGSAVREIRAQAKAEHSLEEEAFKALLPPRCYCGCEEWFPAEFVETREEIRAFRPENSRLRKFEPLASLACVPASQMGRADRSGRDQNPNSSVIEP